MKDSKYKGQLNRCEVESVIAPLRDKEPTPAWRKQFNDMLKHYDVMLKTLMHLTATSNKVNMLGRRYGEYSLQGLLAHYNDGHNDWTKNGFRTINDHLDVLVDYLSKPEENEPETECDHVPTLRERLEQERAEGKWPSVSKRMKEWANNISKLFTDEDVNAPEPINAVDETSETNKEQENNLVKAPENLYVIDKDNQTEASKSNGGLHLHYIYDGDISKLVDSVDTSHKARIKRVKKHKKHRKSNNIFITIRIRR